MPVASTCGKYATLRYEVDGAIVRPTLDRPPRAERDHARDVRRTAGRAGQDARSGCAGRRPDSRAPAAPSQPGQTWPIIGIPPTCT
jgi:hypothetical protein